MAMATSSEAPPSPEEADLLERSTKKHKAQQSELKGHQDFVMEDDLAKGA